MSYVLTVLEVLDSMWPSVDGGLGPNLQVGRGAASGIDSLRKRLMVAIKTSSGKMHTGNPGMWHADIAKSKGITEPYIVGYYDPLNKRFINKSDLNIDSTELTPDIERASRLRAFR